MNTNKNMRTSVWQPVTFISVSLLKSDWTTLQSWKNSTPTSETSTCIRASWKWRTGNVCPSKLESQRRQDKPSDPGGQNAAQHTSRFCLSITSEGPERDECCFRGNYKWWKQQMLQKWWTRHECWVLHGHLEKKLSSWLELHLLYLSSTWGQQLIHPQLFKI